MFKPATAQKMDKLLTKQTVILKGNLGQFIDMCLKL